MADVDFTRIYSNSRLGTVALWDGGRRVICGMWYWRYAHAHAHIHLSTVGWAPGCVKMDGSLRGPGTGKVQQNRRIKYLLSATELSVRGRKRGIGGQ